jgi:hypothetical protein
MTTQATNQAKQYRVYAEQWQRTHTTSMTLYYATSKAAAASARQLTQCGYECTITGPAGNKTTIMPDIADARD